MVRPALTYGCQVWAQPGKEGKIPSALTRPIQAVQTQCLRKVTGAYKTTSTKALHHETATLPIHLYLKQLRVQYAQSSDNGLAQRTIQAACNKIQQAQGRGRRMPQRQEDIDTWKRVPRGHPGESVKNKARRMAFQEWEASWKVQNRPQTTADRNPADPDIWKAATFTTDKDGNQRMTFQGSPARIHSGLKRAQSSIAIQIRSGHIGFNAYLYRRRVPGIQSPQCQCGYPSQNAKHMIMCCPQWAKGRAEIWRQAQTRSFAAMMDSPEDVKRITQWILQEGWLQQFSLAEETEAILAQGARVTED